MKAAILEVTGLDEPTKFSDLSILDVDVIFTARNNTENNNTEIATTNSENGLARCPLCAAFMPFIVAAVVVAVGAVGAALLGVGAIAITTVALIDAHITEREEQMKMLNMEPDYPDPSVLSDDISGKEMK